MAACCPSCMPDISDNLSDLHLLTGGDADGLTVGVQCFQPAAMVDLDVIAVAAAPAVKTVGNGDGSICGGEDWRTLGAGNVGAGMGANRTGDGVYPVSELRGNRTRNGDRPLQCTGRGAGAVGRHDLSPALCKTAEQFCPQFLILWVLQELANASLPSVILAEATSRSFCKMGR